MIYIGTILLIIGIIIAILQWFLTGPRYTAYRGYGFGLGGLLIVAGIILIILGYLVPLAPR